MADRGIMFALSTFAGLEIQVEPTGHGAEVFAYNSEVGAATPSTLRSFVTAFNTWASDAGRGWSGSVTFMSKWIDIDDAWGVMLTGSASSTWTPNATAQSVLNVASGSGLSLTSSAGVRGTLAHDVAVSNLYKVPVGPGSFGRSGGWRPHVAHKALSRPVLSMILTERAANVLLEGLPSAASPRVADVYHEAASEWVSLQVGAIATARPDLTRYHINIEAQGAEQ